MNISVNGQSRIPPGFRFHPTEEELLQYYLRKKVANDKIDLDVIFEVDLNKLEPWDIQEKCRIGTTPQNDWYFFSHKDKKYPTGTRTNRATVAGFWKATGRDKVIYSNCRRIGMRKTLVFYKGRAPHGQKSDWIMHEYRLDDCSNINDDIHVTSHAMNNNNGDFTQEEGWVVCRIFKKKNHIKTLDHHHNNNTSSINNNNNNNNNNQMSLLMESHSTMLDSPSDHDLDNDQGALEQIFQSLGSKNNVFTRPSFHHRLDNSNSINSISNSISMISNSSNNNNKFMKLPSLESPNNSTTHLTTFYHHPMHPENDVVSAANTSETDLGDWATLDRLVATHLNGHSTTDTTMSSIFSTSSSSLSTSTGCKIYNNITTNNNHNNNNSDALENNYGSNNNNNNNEIIDLWSFTRSTLQIDPLCHVSDGGI